MLRLSAVCAVLGLSSSAFAVDLNGVKNFQPEQYLGTWYQIQSTNPSFQRGCKCAKAEYSQLDERTIGIVNTCINEKNEIRTIEGKATIKNPENPSRLAVKFSFFMPNFVNYVVTEVGENYEYSVVVSPGNSPIWILSRTKTLPPEVLSGIRLRLIQAGVRIANLKDTDPNQCQDF